jgi:hypothetical protein
MRKYSTITNECEAKYLEFLKVLTQGSNKIRTKFCVEMIDGILKSSSVLLSEIARKSERKIDVKNGVERLSNQLNKFDETELAKKYLKIVRASLPENPLFYVDGTDIIKPCAKHMEGLAVITDGSKKHTLGKGYYVNEIAAITLAGQPVSLASTLYSVKEKGFNSSNDVMFNDIYKVLCNVSPQGTFIFDRGLDDVKTHIYLQGLRQNYIFRANNKRNVLINNKERNIVTAAKNLKCRYDFSIKFQSGIKTDLRVGFKPVALINNADTEITMVVVQGFRQDNEPFILLTNRIIDNEESCLAVVRDYLSRWKIEEYFKFKKQNYEWENVRARKLKVLKNINVFLSLAIGFLGLMQRLNYSKKIMLLAKPIKQKAVFNYYRFHTGFMLLVLVFKTNILDFLYPKKPVKLTPLEKYITYKNHHQNFNKIT